MKQITKIVMTGGPAGGKTTLTTRLVKELTALGYRVLIVPEAATELISGFGIKPFGNCVSMYEFQYFVTDSQLQKERLAARAAELVPEEKVLIICDRGLLDNKAYVSVSDVGETIPPDDLPYIFDRFHKSDRSRSLDKDGVGLGLSLVKSIINGHDEDIVVRSENGVTEFVFSLALAES